MKLNTVMSFAFLCFVECTVCLGVFVLPLGVIWRLCSVTEALPRHFYTCTIFFNPRPPDPKSGVLTTRQPGHVHIRLLLLQQFQR